MKSALLFVLALLLIAPGTLAAQVIDIDDLQPRWGDDFAKANFHAEQLKLQKVELELQNVDLKLQRQYLELQEAAVAQPKVAAAEGQAETTRPVALFVESVLTGQTLQCIYDWAGSTYIKTVKADQTCPLSMKIALE